MACHLRHYCTERQTWLQVGFKRELIKEVRLFVADAQDFRQDWEANGPMVPGLDPMDAVDRLKKFQLMFEVLLLCSVHQQSSRTCNGCAANLLHLQQ